MCQRNVMSSVTSPSSSSREDPAPGTGTFSGRDCRRLRAGFLAIFDSIKSPASPPPFPSFFPSNRAARLPQLITGACQAAAVPRVLRWPSTSPEPLVVPSRSPHPRARPEPFPIFFCAVYVSGASSTHHRRRRASSSLSSPRREASAQFATTIGRAIVFLSPSSPPRVPGTTGDAARPPPRSAHLRRGIASVFRPHSRRRPTNRVQHAAVRPQVPSTPLLVVSSNNPARRRHRPAIFPANP